MEVDDIPDEIISAIKQVLLRGGELKLVVICRGNERIPEIFVYPENKIRCDTITLTE